MDYHKIVRDKVPGNLMNIGAVIDCITEKDDDYSHLPALERELDNRVSRYKECIRLNKSMEDLADIIDLCYAIALRKGFDRNAIDRIRDDMEKRFGSYGDLCFLRSVDYPDDNASSEATN